MKKNELGQTIINEDDMMDVIYSGNEVSSIVVNDSKWIERYNHYCNLFELDHEVDWELESNKSLEEYVTDCLTDWNMPKEYSEIDLSEFLHAKCTTQEQIDRVDQELILFKERNMDLVLKWMIYFVHVMTENEVLWGVGRGSSVSSYVLFLIGVHRVDSLKYDLSIEEFLK